MKFKPCIRKKTTAHSKFNSKHDGRKKTGNSCKRIITAVSLEVQTGALPASVQTWKH